MRACEGCRRRKIKCDAATTNTWPCSACIRLKLHCKPPTVNYDGSNSHGFEPEKLEYESGGSGEDDYNGQIPMQQHLQPTLKTAQQTYGQQQMPYNDQSGSYQPMSYVPVPPNQQPMQFSPLNAPPIMESQYAAQPSFAMPPMQTPMQSHHHPSSPENYQRQQQTPQHRDQYGPQDLADYLGDLKMDETATGLSLTVRSMFFPLICM